MLCLEEKRQGVLRGIGVMNSIKVTCIKDVYLPDPVKMAEIQAEPPYVHKHVTVDTSEDCEGEHLQFNASLNKRISASSCNCANTT